MLLQHFRRREGRSTSYSSVANPSCSPAQGEHMKKWLPTLLVLTALLLGSALAQTVPTSKDQVAEPGGTLPGNPQVALVKIADGFEDPTGVTGAFDGSGRIFVVEREGRIQVISADGSVAADPFLDLTVINPLGSDVQTGFVEQGLYSIAFHPKFSENGYFYVHYASLPFNGDGTIVRFQVDSASPDMVTADRANETAKVIMRIEQPYYNHNGGQLAFGPDGYLYIASGDGGWEGDPLDAGQRLDTLLGKLLRIDVDVSEEDDDMIPYRIPRDNPFATAAKEQLMSLFGLSETDFAQIRTTAKPEIWAYGLRNPYRFHFDQKTGDLFIADVGQNYWEEIDFQPADSEGGENYGWRFNMGTHCHPLTGPPDQESCPQVGVLPAGQYPHEQPYPGADPLTDGFGCAAEGLGVANYAGMTGVYLVGDWCSGRLFGLGWDGTAWQMQEFMQTSLQFTAGGYDDDGNVLAVNCECFYLADQGPSLNPPGSVWRIMAADEVPEGAETARVVK